MSTDVEKAQKKKAQRDEANARYKAKKVQEKKELARVLSKVIELLKERNLWANFDHNAQTILLQFADGGGAVGNSIVHKIFGKTVRIGDAVTLEQCFRLTMKGKVELDKKFQDWENSEGVVVAFEENNEDIFKSVYKIVNIKQ